MHPNDPLPITHQPLLNHKKSTTINYPLVLSIPPKKICAPKLFQSYTYVINFKYFLEPTRFHALHPRKKELCIKRKDAKLLVWIGSSFLPFLLPLYSRLLGWGNPIPEREWKASLNWIPSLPSILLPSVHMFPERGFHQTKLSYVFILQVQTMPAVYHGSFFYQFFLFKKKRRTNFPCK